jgi:dienelactone hydrolase
LLFTVSILVTGYGSARAVTAARPRVVVRVLPLARGEARPLPTTVWHPGDLAGQHPVILFSHGLGGLPEHFAPLAEEWARAGYIVVAPAYPHTNGGVTVDARDVRNQPADAAYVLDRVKALAATAGDVLAGHVDTGRVAAVGFSAGGTTTLGMFHAGHDPALRAAVSIAGRRPLPAFGGPATPMLFLHGDHDRVVPIAAGREAYAAVPWPKRFETIRGAGHGEYLNPGDPGHPHASALILDFLAAHLPVR